MGFFRLPYCTCNRLESPTSKRFASRIGINKKGDTPDFHYSSCSTCIIKFIYDAVFDYENKKITYN